MYSQDWVDHMKSVMEHAQPGDAYEVMHVVVDPGVASPIGGSCYVKTEAGYRHCAIFNAEVTGIKQAPFRI